MLEQNDLKIRFVLYEQSSKNVSVLKGKIHSWEIVIVTCNIANNSFYPGE